jgi:hypothetical protein
MVCSFVRVCVPVMVILCYVVTMVVFQFESTLEIVVENSSPQHTSTVEIVTQVVDLTD